MLISERLDGLYRMMQRSESYEWETISSLSRRLEAFSIISEMRVVIEQLEKLNDKLDLEISIEDADIDFDQWSGIGIQSLFNSKYYIEGEEDDAIINKMADLFPSGKSTTLFETTIGSIKTGMRHLSSEIALNHSDIAKTLVNGFSAIIQLLSKIKKKMNDIPDNLYENFCDDFLASDLDLIFQEVERDYDSWKDEHEWQSLQALEDKRTQEILKLLTGGVFSYSTTPTNREIMECPITIEEEALEHNMTKPENIEIECARFSRFVIMDSGVMLIDYAKLGKYLYRHYKDLTYEQVMSLKYFDVIIDFIHHDMAILDPELLVHLPDYEESVLQAILEKSEKIINSCQEHLNKDISQNFLVSYIHDVFYGDLKQESQKKLGGKGVYTHISKMLGMLKSSMKVFKVGTTSDDLAKCLSTLTQKPNKESMKRKIDEGSSDTKSSLRKWTDNYIKEHCYSESDRLFLGLSKTE